MKDKFGEDIQNLNENQSNGYLRRDVKPSYVNLRNEVKSVILETEANRRSFSTAQNNKTEQEKQATFKTKINKFFKHIANK
jgi:hypothetical protein